MKPAAYAAALVGVPLRVSALQGLAGQAVDSFPYCATACYQSFDSNQLSCSSSDATSFTTTPECRAGNIPFLSSLAYCISTHCNYDLGIIETWWTADSTGSSGTRVSPIYSYQETLSNITTPPTNVIMSTATLTSFVRVNETDYTSQYGTLSVVGREEILHVRYGLVLLMLGFGIPLLATWLGYLPYMSGFIRKLKPHLIWPTTIGHSHIRPLSILFGNAPTRGPTLYIAAMVILNIVFLAVNYRSYQPNLKYSGVNVEIEAYIVLRTGCYALALLPVLILFSARNNTLLWLTNWSHETYILLHRWLGRLFAVNVLLHAIFALIYNKEDGSYNVELRLEQWIWGCVGAVAVVAILISATLWIRRSSYEWFLVSHNVLAVFVLVGTWYHVLYLFEGTSGYEQWLYTAFGVWGLDRVFRILRVLKNGVRRAHITEIGGDIVRIDIPGIRWGFQPGRVVYAFFPTLHPLRPWENHPFSVLPTAMLERSSTGSHTSDADSSSSMSGEDSRGDVESRFGASKFGTCTDVEKQLAVSEVLPRPVKVTQRAPTAGLTLFVRRSQGITKALMAGTNILTFLDGPYPGNPTASILTCDRVLLICGGIGVTAILPWVDHHPNVKLAWSLKDSAAPLVGVLEKVMARVIEKDVRVGRRLEIEALLAEEVLAGWRQIGVVVCGPQGMCEDVRAMVIDAAKRGEADFELEVHAYCW